MWRMKIAVQTGITSMVQDGTKVTSQFYKANKTKPTRAKVIGYISNEKPYLGVFLFMKNSYIV